MEFSFVQYLLTAICIVAFINILLINKLNARTNFSLVLRFFNAYLCFHAAYVIVVEQFFGDQLWLDRYVPFGLMYGPFLYFAFLAISDYPISIQKILLHSFPFLLFTIGFLDIVILGGNASFIFLYYKMLNLATATSFSVYSLMAMFWKKPLNDQVRHRKLVVLSAVIILLFVSIVTITAISYSQKIIEKPNAVLLLRTMIYSCMLISAAMIFKYKINVIFFKINNADELNKIHKINMKPILSQSAKYEKSTLSNKQLDDYSKKLEKLMLSQKVYLTTDLSLQKLAQLIRIPNHHLTQVLSLRIRKGFYDYVNGFRVQYACMLLESEEGVNLETIAEKSGFNSKVSFNRHFKSVVGYTPSAYRNKMKKANNAS